MPKTKTPPMETATGGVPLITLADGTDYLLPFRDLLPRLPESEYEALKANIRQHGIIYAVVANQLDENTFEVWDGGHRVAIARDLDYTSDQVPIQLLSPTTAEDRLDHAIDLNFLRRHLSAGERAQLAATLRQTGLSNRAIADRLGVDESTIRADLRTPVRSGAGNPAPERTNIREDLAEKMASAKAARARGQSFQAIADLMQVSKATVHSWVNNPDGIDPRDGEQVLLEDTPPDPHAHAQRAMDRKHGTLSGKVTPLRSTTKPAEPRAGGEVNPAQAALPVCDLCEHPAAALVPDGYGQMVCSTCFVPEPAETLLCDGCKTPSTSLETAPEGCTWNLRGRKICPACHAQEADRIKKWAEDDAERERKRAEREAAEKAAVAHLRIEKISADRWAVMETRKDGSEVLAGLINRGTPPTPSEPKPSINGYTAHVVLEHKGETFDRPLGGDATFWTQKDVLKPLAEARKNPGKFLKAISEPRSIPVYDESPRPKTVDSEDTEAEKIPKKPPRANKLNSIDFSRWKDYAHLITSSLMVFGPRAKGEGRSNHYHGNFIPQVPANAIERFTQEGDVVLDLFLGGGTAMVESVRLGRHFIGVDIQKAVVDDAKAQLSKLANSAGVHVSLLAGDSTGALMSHTIRQELVRWGKTHVDHILLHPPYWCAIRFAKEEQDIARDLSWASSVDDFLRMFARVVWQTLPLLTPGRHLTLVMADGWNESEWIPLGWECMDVIRGFGGVRCKGICPKDMQGNERAVGKNGPLQRWRALWNGTFEFAHEYIITFQKTAGTPSEDGAE